jgi:hypothetical protein
MAIDMANHRPYCCGVTTKQHRTGEVSGWVASGAAKRWRASKLTASEAAAQLGVDIRTLLRWEAGESVPRGTKLADYHRFLKRMKPKPKQENATT